MSSPAVVADPARFALAGNATFTIVSKKTGTRFTYRVRQAETGGAHFVSVLTGADNESDYAFLGTIFPRGFFHGKKSRIGADAPSAKAFAWFWRHVVQGKVDGCEVWHEGKCGRCGRKLTVPESIETGLGPECAGRV